MKKILKLEAKKLSQYKCAKKWKVEFGYKSVILHIHITKKERGGWKAVHWRTLKKDSIPNGGTEVLISTALVFSKV